MNYSLISAVLVVSLFWTQVSSSAIPSTNSSSAQSPIDEGNPTPFIVGGVEAKKNEFPFLVNLLVKQDDGKTGLCGGALIYENMVLTAAHCVYQVKAKNINVTAGDHNIRQYEGTEQTTLASAVKWHENYVADNTKIINDIALIRLAKNFTVTASVRTINLPATSFNASLSKNGTVAGWGVEQYNSQFTPSILRKVNVGIVNDPECSRQGVRDRKLQFCAGNVGKDSCQGDSGGPFICDGAINAVCGIVSYGNNCGINPGVYTHVPSYVKWINDNRKFSSAGALSSSFVLLFVSISSLVYKNL